MFPKVSIIILNWNGKKDTIECLNHIKQITYPNYEIILVDNGSTDGSVEYIKKFHQEIEIIENEKNLGFAEGNNVAIRRSIEKGTDYIFLVNNDTIVDPEVLSNLLKVFKTDTNIGIVGPTVYHYNKKNSIQSAGGKICWYKGKTFPLTNENDIKLDIIRDVDYIMGCAILAKSELFKKIGYLNKNYFAYWEETEWCVRAKKAGYRIVHVPSAKIWHKGGSTSRKTSGFYEYQITRNMFWFMRKNANKKQYTAFIFYFILCRFWFLSGILIYHQNINGFISFLKGIKDGVIISN